MRIALALALLLSASAQAGPAPKACQLIPSFWLPELFARYPAKPTRGPWTPPDVRKGEPHRFRTVLRRDGQRDPDFAGRFQVVTIGCGTGSGCPAFVDRVSGRVWFVPALRVVSIMPVDLGFSRMLTYRRDSRLLVVVGIRNEMAGTAGASLYEWRENGPRLIRFVSEKDLCVEDKPA